MKASRSFSRLTSLVIMSGWLACGSLGLGAPGGGGSIAGSAPTGIGGSHATAAASATGAHFAHVSAGMAARAATLGGGFWSAPGASSGIGTVTMGPRANAPQFASVRPLVQMPTVRNAWTDPANPRVAGGFSIASRQNTSTTANDHTGNHLYPGAYGYTPTRPANGRSQHGQYGDDVGRHQQRYYYNNFPYAIYYPYLFNNYGYGGVGTYGYASLNNDDFGLPASNSVADLGAPDFSNVPTNYYTYSAPDQRASNAAAPSSPAQPLPDAPAVGPQGPSSADKSSGASQGPDSLVEAVQNELLQRGYFAGRANAMYGPTTQEAIRRFQTDQHLPATGRINEATLHALRLD